MLFGEEYLEWRRHNGGRIIQKKELHMPGR